MNPGDVDGLLAKIRAVLEEDDEDAPVGEFRIVARLDGEPTELRIRITASQLRGLVEDMAGLTRRYDGG